MKELRHLTFVTLIFALISCGGKNEGNIEQEKKEEVEPGGEAVSQQQPIVSESNDSRRQSGEAIEETELDRDGDDLVAAEQKEESTEVGAEGENGGEARQEEEKEEKEPAHP